MKQKKKVTKGPTPEQIGKAKELLGSIDRLLQAGIFPGSMATEVIRARQFVAANLAGLERQ